MNHWDILVDVRSKELYDQQLLTAEIYNLNPSARPIVSHEELVHTRVASLDLETPIGTSTLPDEDVIDTTVETHVGATRSDNELLTTELHRIVEDPELFPSGLLARLDQLRAQVMIFIKVWIPVFLPIDQLQDVSLAIMLPIFSAYILPQQLLGDDLPGI